ncbi:urease accessory protein UreF [Actinoplanes italicus]|uniref:urease accessory protein UreF n=1 Tax=Actinoplanes italicus TaxID=113567 RepID=UPI001EF35E11|nr:urease accessory UreF family protein [Actinoplanes italicus]
MRNVDGLAGFLRGKLATTGLVSAAFAAAACADVTRSAELDGGLDARTPSPALRKASRAQGRALLRAGRAMWSLPPIGREPHQPVALGVLAAAAGLTPADASIAAAHGLVTGSASAGVRLLGLDPYAVHALLARLAPECDRIAAAAAARAGDPVDDLPAAGAPLLDIGAEHHATWEVRLFAS